MKLCLEGRPEIWLIYKGQSDVISGIGEGGNFSGEGLGLNFPLGGGAIFQPRGGRRICDLGLISRFPRY